nr:JAB domain-containing protein [Lachnospiraceae bacterium]
CFLLMFDTRMHLIKESLLCSGTVKEALLSPRELFSLALRHQAVSVILLHNHPGGDPAPSKADREMTGRIAALGDMLQVPLLDHIILGDRHYYSFKEKGAL